MDKVRKVKPSSRVNKRLTKFDHEALSSFGDSLKEAVKLSKFTQKEVAQRLNLKSDGNLSDYCKGNRPISPEQLICILEILDDPSLSSMLVESYKHCLLPMVMIPFEKSLADRLTLLEQFSCRGSFLHASCLDTFRNYDLHSESLETRFHFDRLMVDAYILSHRYGMATSYIKDLRKPPGSSQEFNNLQTSSLYGRLLRCAGDPHNALKHLSIAVEIINELHGATKEFPWVNDAIVAMIERDWCLARVLSKTGDARMHESIQVSTLLGDRANRIQSGIRGRSGTSELRVGEVHYLDNCEVLARCARLSKDLSAVEDFLTEIDIEPFKRIRPRKERVGLLRGWLLANSGDLSGARFEYVHVARSAAESGNCYHRMQADFALMRLSLHAIG